MPPRPVPAVLRVDLAAAAVRREAAPPLLLSRQRGGRALATALCDAPARLAWDDPGAPLCLAAGALAGCDLPGCGHLSLAFFSPRTGGPAVASLGGGLGHALARAGLAAVVVTGRAPEPVGLCLEDGEARLVPAGELAELPVPALFDALSSFDAALVCGPAARAGAGLATVVADRWHDAGPTGAGLALAAKNLVYVAVFGTGGVAVADPEGLARARAAMDRLIAASPALAGPCGFGSHGTAALVDLTHGRRMQPTNDFRATFFPATALVNAPALGKGQGVRGVSCPGCPVPCRRLDAAGRLLPDADALSHFTALLGLADPKLAVEARWFCLDQGLDPAGAAACLAAWGTGRAIAPDAALVREGLAALAAGDALGREIEACLRLAVKGVPLPAFDPRGACGLSLSLAVGTGGPDPWRGGCLAHELLRKPVATDRFTFEGKARAVALGENALAAAQSLGGCAFLSLAVTLEEWALALCAVTGEAVSAGDLAALGEGAVRRERAQQRLQGLDASADDLPECFFAHPGTAGDGIVVPPLDRRAFLAARDKYRRLRGEGAAVVAPAAAPAPVDALTGRFAERLARAGLCAPGQAAIVCLDEGASFSRQDFPLNAFLAETAARLGVACLMLVPPAEPYRAVLEYLAAREAPAIRPRDCETRTFFHDIPVVEAPRPEAAAAALSRRKGAYLPGFGILAHGALSPEQAFVTVSSVAFAGFVKFFADHLAAHRAGSPDAARLAAFEAAVRALPPAPAAVPPLAEGPFPDSGTALAAMTQAGRATVDLGLVDSVFGNISCNLDGVLAISQTGSALDALEGAIDLCPLDGSSCAGLTASSELSAHAALIARDPRRAILHGHPKFAVIMSMDCADSDFCPRRDSCHVDCDRSRFVDDIPIVPGEVGCGPRGLVHTMPPALAGRRGVVVLGHGVFTMGRHDFRDALADLCAIETRCRACYFEALGLEQA
ncbi:aldehyde ferredoxin oxidoreductase C-terminal domain-containing protein [Solidesulfovibrio sp.]|uniref:aldehyde ferredoxin oxidoreductase C-terminal domain-containing protein n=1 Tax=Solidesulfovibrio sp. TaxID=2910990 RepID=UPI00261D801F|nr:aldehyde ferredoxin oxidoreductase C-terminal domain-containing protein [Solidesulfovibrio sp.]